MEDSDQSLVPSRGHDTITICEDNFGGKNQNGNRDYYSYNNVTFASNYYWSFHRFEEVNMLLEKNYLKIVLCEWGHTKDALKSSPLQYAIL